MQGQNLAFSLQLPTGLHKITILVAQQKFLGSRNWLCTRNIPNFSSQL